MKRNIKIIFLLLIIANNAFSQDSIKHTERVNLNDVRCRQTILDYIEVYRQAYIRQDIKYIKQVMIGDDSMTIFGTKTDDGKIKQNALNRQQYIEKLRTAMAKCSHGNKTNKLTVEFDKVSILKSDKEDNLYLIHLLQKWNWGRYSDKSWLTLIIDFCEQEPVIWLRTLQDSNLKENELYNFSCFYNQEFY